MQDIKASKKVMRASMLASREQVLAKQRLAWSHAINQKLIAHLQEQKLNKIKLYIPFRGEVDIWTTINWCINQGIQVLAPKSEQENKQMHWYAIGSKEDLKKGAYGILEPDPLRCTLVTVEAEHVIVPGVAFTKDGKRLGYGGGYYDRFYEKAQQLVQQWIGVCYEMQITEHIPMDEHDMCCHLIFTNEGIYDRDIEGERE